MSIAPPPPPKKKQKKKQKKTGILTMVFYTSDPNLVILEWVVSYGADKLKME